MSTKHYETTKESLIEEIKRRQEDKIIEKSNANLLIKLIDKADDLNEAINIATLGTTYKRTGFHFDKRLEKMDRVIKYFKRIEELSFSDGSDKPANKLIIGDNYEAMQNLLIEYKGKVDVIYIDPPYGKDSMGEFAHTNYDNAITRDNLLSMLYSRLVLAKELLSDTGVIFCSIDDKNQAYVKCLFDEIYGEYNFIGTIVVQTATDNNPTQIDTEHEYIISYAKNENLQDDWYGISKGAEKIQNKYEELKNKHNDITIIEQELRKWINKNKAYLNRVDHYNNVDEKGVFSDSSNSSNPHPGGYMFDIMHPSTNKPCPKPANGWRWPKETFEKYCLQGEVQWGKDESTQPHVKKRIETVKEQLKSIIYADNRKTTADLGSIIGKNEFDNPKSVEVLKYIFSFCSNQSSIFLDFFAGSGTTGQAVLELNKEDDGNREFILVQLDEDIDKALEKAKGQKEKETFKNQIKFCDELNRPHKLSEITAERLRRVMTGKSLTGKNDFEWLKKNEPYGGILEVYNIERIADTSDIKGRMPFDVIDETLYGQKKFKNVNDKIKWVCENFEHTEKYIESEEEYVTRSHRPTK